MKNNIKQLRKSEGLRQEDMAKILGVSRQTIIAIENDKYNPTLELAMKIGSDVPSFIKNKTARVGGKGNKVDLVENNLKDSIILIKPLDFGVSTKEAYESFDNLKEVKYTNFDKIIECLKDNNRIALENSIENSLEQGILETDINIKMLKITLNSVISGKKFFMSGSGSTYYTFVTELEKSQIETRLKTFVDNVKIIICKTIN